MNYFSSLISPLSQNQLHHFLGNAAAFIPEALRELIRHASAYVPVEINVSNVAEFMLYFTVASLILSVLGRVVLGQRSSLNHSLSSVMGITLVYALTIVIYTFRPWNLELLLSPLPFVTFSGEYLILFPITDAQFPALCTQILSMIILAFSVNLLDTIFPQGESVLSWYLLRFICVIFSMVMHLVLQWAVRSFVPALLVTYAPVVLLILLLIMLLSGLFSLIIGMVVAVSNPFLGAMYSFFFSNLVGKQVSKAVFSTAILCSIFFILDYFGYTVICITMAALAAYIPAAVIIMALWYLIGHIL